MEKQENNSTKNEITETGLLDRGEEQDQAAERLDGQGRLARQLFNERNPVVEPRFGNGRDIQAMIDKQVILGLAAFAPIAIVHPFGPHADRPRVKVAQYSSRTT